MNLDLKIPWMSKEDQVKRTTGYEFYGIRDTWNQHDRGVLAWDTVKTGNLILTTSSVSSSSSIKTSDNFVFIDATNALTLTLPTAVGAQGKSYTFIVTTGNKTVTITTTASQTINGATNAYLPTQYTTMRVVSDGSNWFMY